jgi:hypothetical protein
MDVGAAFVADGQTAAAVHPGMGAFHHPVGPSQPSAALNSSQGNPRRDAAGPALLATALVVVTLVGVELVRPLFRTAFPAPERRDRIERRRQNPAIVLVGRPGQEAERRAASVGDEMALCVPYRDPSCSGSSRLPPFCWDRGAVQRGRALNWTPPSTGVRAAFRRQRCLAGATACDSAAHGRSP